MEQIRDIFIQVAIVILPFFLYEAIRLSRYHVTLPKVNGVHLAVLSGLTVMLCMTSPIALGEGEYYDFHYIPLMSACLYGGPFGIIAAAAAVLGHFLLYGQEGLLPFGMHTALFTLFSLLLWRRWKTLSKSHKIFAAFTYLSVYALIQLLVMMPWTVAVHGLSASMSQLLAMYIFVSGLLSCIMMLQVYLTEYLYENALLRVEMFKSEKLNIVSELAASVAHEVRNPLTVVRGFIQLIEGDEQGKNSQYLRLVLNELDRAEHIISDYLNLARPQIEEMKRVALSEQLTEMTTLMSSFAAMQGVYLQTEIAPQLYTFGDKTRLQQAIMNIVKNGVEAIGQGKGYLKVSAHERNGRIAIKVKDSGVGMTKEQLARLGQPYYSLKEKGTGLGLMVTFSIIEAHGGAITYTSEPGKGTEVLVTLPSAPAE